MGKMGSGDLGGDGLRKILRALAGMDMGALSQAELASVIEVSFPRSVESLLSEGEDDFAIPPRIISSLKTAARQNLVPGKNAKRG